MRTGNRLTDCSTDPCKKLGLTIVVPFIHPPSYLHAQCSWKELPLLLIPVTGMRLTLDHIMDPLQNLPVKPFAGASTDQKRGSSL